MPFAPFLHSKPLFKVYKQYKNFAEKNQYFIMLKREIILLFLQRADKARGSKRCRCESQSLSLGVKSGDFGAKEARMLDFVAHIW